VEVELHAIVTSSIDECVGMGWRMTSEKQWFVAKSRKYFLCNKFADSFWRTVQ